MSTETPAPPGTTPRDPYLRLQQSPEFSSLRRSLRSFVFPMTVAFLAWYALYVILSAYARGFMSTKVVGNINVAAGAVFDAQSAPSTITVGHNVTAAAGSLLGLGCQPTNTIGMFAGVPCAADPTGHTTITINGNVTATDANTVLMRGAVAAGAGKLTVNGNVTLTGGSSENPWSIKGNTIGGNLTISGVTAEFLGVQFNTIGGNATLTNITVNDVHPGAPGVAVVENTVARNLNCTGLAPGVSGGFIPGEVNHVGHNANGQCASISVPLS